MLEWFRAEPSRHILILHGNPEETHILEVTADVADPSSWLPVWEGASPDVSQTIKIESESGNTLFYRARVAVP